MKEYFKPEYKFFDLEYEDIILVSAAEENILGEGEADEIW